MERITKSLIFSNEFSVDDWNSLLNTELRKYFINDEVFNENKEILRTEFVNYIRIYSKNTYHNLFEWTYNQFTLAMTSNIELTIKELSNSFYDLSKTDMRWITNVIGQPRFLELSERDKIYQCFKMIDEVLEGCFNPRFRMLYNIIFFNKTSKFKENKDEKLGILVNSIPKEVENEISLYLKDPIVNIPTHQWRNIASHKSYDVQKDSITVTYGSQNKDEKSLSYSEFYDILTWVHDMYRAIRLAEVFFTLNYIKNIVKNLGGTSKVEIRHEASLFHLIHNMQIIGFKYVSMTKENRTVALSFNTKEETTIMDSLIHASQCLDQIACSIYDDLFVRDDYDTVQVNVLEGNSKASASVRIDIALAKAQGNISQKEYIENIVFKL